MLCIIAGALFGLYWGAVAVLTGSLLAAVTQFALSRRLLRSRIRRALAGRPALAAIQHAVASDEFRLQVLVRLTPLNPATVSYLLGAAGVRPAWFMVACLALLPNLMIEVYIGHVGKQAALLTGSHAGAANLHDLAMIGGFLLVMAVMVFISRMASKEIAKTVAETGINEGQPAPQEP